jgi:hypothetical protein
MSKMIFARNGRNRNHQFPQKMAAVQPKCDEERNIAISKSIDLVCPKINSRKTFKARG